MGLPSLTRLFFEGRVYFDRLVYVVLVVVLLLDKDFLENDRVYVRGREYANILDFQAFEGPVVLTLSSLASD